MPEPEKQVTPENARLRAGLYMDRYNEAVKSRDTGIREARSARFMFTSLVKAESLGKSTLSQERRLEAQRDHSRADERLRNAENARKAILWDSSQNVAKNLDAYKQAATEDSAYQRWEDWAPPEVSPENPLPAPTPTPETTQLPPIET